MIGEIQYAIEICKVSREREHKAKKPSTNEQL